MLELAQHIPTAQKVGRYLILLEGMLEARVSWTLLEGMLEGRVSLTRSQEKDETCNLSKPNVVNLRPPPLYHRASKTSEVMFK